MKLCLLIFGLFVTTKFIDAAMTEKQLNATKKLVRNTCQNKAKVTNEQIDILHNGDFSDELAHCYLHCIISTYKLLGKDNQFDWEGGLKAIAANAPPSISEPGQVSIKNCKDAVKTPSNKCTAAMEIARCIYNDNPQNYFFP